MVSLLVTIAARNEAKWNKQVRIHPCPAMPYPSVSIHVLPCPALHLRCSVLPHTSLLQTCCVLLLKNWAMHNTYCPALDIHCPAPIKHYPTPITHCSAPITHCPAPNTLCPAKHTLPCPSPINLRNCCASAEKGFKSP
jgi:hypothetical protein